MREKEKGKESSIVCLWEREGEGREVEEAGTQRISTQADIETSQKKKKYEMQGLANSQANKSELMLTHQSVCKDTKTTM